MKTTIDLWELSHLYLEDAREVLSESDYNFCKGAIRARDYKRIVNCFRDSGPEYRGPHESRVLSQLSAFFKKNDAFADRQECLSAAQRNFELAEKYCRITNKRLDFYYIHPDRLDIRRQEQIEVMRTYIARTLGPFSRLLKDLPARVRVTSGASEQYTRDRSLPYLKVRKKVSCSYAAVPYVQALSKFFMGTEAKLRICNHNRVTTVPKNSDTYRSIACEPVGNLPFQLAIDSYMKERLRRQGINLNDQSYNQRLAREGSLTGELATIDLTMASDTLAYNVIPYLFDNDWYRALKALRSPKYKGVFGDGTYSKFSSMGNGFTFVVETLVFAAACAAVGSTRYSVYGDDIIIESSLFSEVCSLLRYLGFRPNEKKSYKDGPFRESCGVDYHSGINIRPFFIREVKMNAPKLCHFINGIAAVTLPEGRVWKYLRSIYDANQKFLPLIPRIEDTTVGVHVTIHYAYENRLIKNNHPKFGKWIPCIRGYITKNRIVKRYGIRNYLLWFFNRFSSNDIVRTSEVDGGKTYYRRNWIPFHPGRDQTPVHLYMWTDYITRRP